MKNIPAEVTSMNLLILWWKKIKNLYNKRFVTRFKNESIEEIGRKIEHFIKKNVVVVLNDLIFEIERNEISEKIELS